jgi:hypothetical protein
MFLHIQNTQTWRVGSFYFLKHLLFTKCALFLLKIEKGLTLMIIKMKGLELIKKIKLTNLSTFGSNMLLTLKIMDLENVALTKVVHIYVMESMNI